MAAQPVQALPFREARKRALEAAAFVPLFTELGELAHLAPEIVMAELQAFVELLRARRKTCYRCATETIGKYRPKRGQRAFCYRGCSSAQARDDFSGRASATSSAS